MNRAEFFPHRIISKTDVTKSSFVLRLERNNLEFRTGQHINVGPVENGYTREYSVYSGEHDNYLEVLIKEVSNGFVSPHLRKLNSGDVVMVEPPLGYFFLPAENLLQKKFLFVATGTGIAPYHSFIKTWSDIDYTLLHGVTDISESIQPSFYDPNRLILCTSQSNEGHFSGRVTKWLSENDLQGYDHIYLCGNRNMINDVYNLLNEKGIENDKISAEAYF
ncbi:ferredoxin--NADP reductase [Natronoflexus pectinivorans]|uniref:Ferredoxin--NADP+ reductase n=1 Tax=Natronoflexus pectinivorans TaxID=682526 RepID=A0A4R2GFG7_9BACT|nr:FAD-binding oxidoreductase [Natronoflexus pectinivorans]TCO06927.1 ferredoxin--NADP+ reductase [Natronoflexus pectinivorans]